MNHESRYKVALLDMDGTLLDGNKEIHPDNVGAITEARKAGFIPFLASGRYTPSMEMYADMLHIEDCPLICLNGMVKSGRQGLRRRSLWYQYIDPATVNDLLMYAKGINCTGEPIHVQYFYHHEDTSQDVVFAMDNWISKWYASIYEKFGRAHVGLLSSFDSLQGRNALKLLMMGDHDKMDKIEAELEQRYGRDLSIARTYRDNPERPSQLEIMNMSKGLALIHLALFLGVTRRDMVAFVDGDNDLDMAKMAGLTIATANATQKIREIADHVTKKTNDEGGVAEGLYKFVLNS